MGTARKRIAGVALALLAAGGAALAWRAVSAPTADTAAAQRKPDPLVSVTVAQRTDLPVRAQAEGHVTPLAQVDIRPQVGGTVLQVHFSEGDEVRAGHLLFTLDASEAQAQLARTEAGAANARVQVQEAQREHRRAVELGRASFISPSAIETAAGKVQSLEAVLAATEAEVRSARLTVQRARIAAPVSARAGRPTVHPGSLVQPSAQAPLVTLVPFDTLGVDFSVPEANLQALLAASAAHQVHIRLDGQENLGDGAEGKLLAIGNTVNPATGTIDVRAEFANRQRRLWPGAFVRLQIEAGVQRGVVVLPADTVLEGPAGRFVFVVREDGKVRQVAVTLVRMQERVAVVEGLQGGERVVSQGGRDLRDGTRVRIGEAKLPGEMAGTGAGAQTALATR
jgi:RND family efflux transporter MFP subunit